MVTAREAGSWVLFTQSWLLSGNAVPGLLVRTPCFGVLLLPRNLPALCREVWVSWRVGVCSGEDGPSRPCWAPNPQALAVVHRAAVLWFTAVGWAGADRGSPETTLWPLLSYCLRKQGRHYVLALGAWEGCTSQSLLWLGV